MGLGLLKEQQQFRVFQVDKQFADRQVKGIKVKEFTF